MKMTFVIMLAVPSKVLLVIFNLNKGWREEMEDEILIKCDLSDGNILFGVFDGHGGMILLIHN